MDLWNVPAKVQERAALRKFACVGVRRVQLGDMLSGLYRSVRCISDYAFDEMLYDSDIRAEDYADEGDAR